MFPRLLAGGHPLVHRPAPLLRRLRPVRLGRVAAHLGDFGRRARVLTLLQAHFPDRLKRWSADSFWFEVYCNFLNCVKQADWFEVDWQTIEVWETNWIENGDDDCGGFDVLVDFLRGIPAMCWGWGPTEAEQEWEEGYAIQEYPALELLRYLCLGSEAGRHLTESTEALLTAIGFYHYDRWDSGEIRDRLERATRRMKPPWKWLPEMADFACDRSGNLILDTTGDPHDPWPCRWTWEKDLEFVRDEYAKAKPALEHFRIFIQEIKSDDDLELIARLAIGKKKRRRK